MTRPSLPKTPACHEWAAPMLPMPSRIDVIRDWQAGRCAICGDQPGRLHEDHSHVSGNTRGFLCVRCNTSEGRSSSQVFALYRDRHPASILGVLHRRGRQTHPDFLEADEALSRALAVAWTLTHLDEHYREVERYEYFKARGAPGIEPRPLPEWTDLARAVHRVGLTADEWAATLDRREELLYDSVTVHLPDDAEFPQNACGNSFAWWPPSGIRRPCPECFVLEPERMSYMVGPEGRGPLDPPRLPPPTKRMLADLWK